MIRAGVVGALFPLIVGCSWRTIHTDSQALSLIGQTGTLSTPQSVTLTNGYPPKTVNTRLMILSRTSTRGVFGGAGANYRDLTETAIEVTKRYLAKSGVSSGLPAARTVTLRVANVAIRQVGEGGMNLRFNTGLMLYAKLGDRTQETSVRGEDNLPVDVSRSVERAIRAAVIALLNDPEFVNYVNAE